MFFRIKRSNLNYMMNLGPQNKYKCFSREYSRKHLVRKEEFFKLFWDSKFIL